MSATALDMWTRTAAFGYADPRRLHPAGRRARLLLDNARASVAESLGVRADEVTFTESGTRAVHLGLLGMLRPDDRLLVGAVEHASVLEAARWHEGRGGSVTSLPVDGLGRLLLPSSEAVGDAGRAVVAVQQGNHEVGTLQPVAEVAALGAPVFVDACASAGRLPLPDGWSVAALSAHKWGGPAGVGVLVVRKGVRWRAPFPVDDRADHRSTGFENLPGVMAAAAALAERVAERDALNARHKEWIDLIRGRLAELDDIDVVGDPVERLPHVLTFSCLYLDGESLVDALAREGFEVASGSACTTSSLEPSHVLAAMGALTHGNVRVSLGPDATHEQVEAFIAVLPRVVSRLREEAGV